ncbi:MAG: hypothetical protein AMXMBFR84_25910 [Candidatus Hydrogenedentota bacterium]
MPIRLNGFRGIVPMIASDKLPEGAAQLAHNCDISGGAIKRLRLPGPYNTMHEGPYLKSGVPSSDVFKIPKPSRPTQNSLAYIANPEEWLQIFAYDWVSQFSDVTGEMEVTALRADALTISQVAYNEASMFVICFLGLNTYEFTIDPEHPYFFKGPQYRFAFAADAGNDYGGPILEQTYPTVASESDLQLPNISVPLYDKNAKVYANMQAADVYGPTYEETYVVETQDITIRSGGCWVVFRFDMNYTRPRQQQFYYVTSVNIGDIDENTPIEGPPSKKSDRLIVQPGQILTLNTPKPSGYSQLRIYRSTTGRDDFVLLDDIPSGETTYEDYTDTPQTDEPIPPFGNHGGTKSTFLRGSFLHPNQYAVALYDDKVWKSDIIRFHAWPKEWSTPYRNPMAIALAGSNTTLVFDRVGDDRQILYGEAGGNPALLSKTRLSDTHPLLNVRGLCRIGQTVFWPTQGGLAASNGGAPQIITKDHYTRAQWMALSPEHMTCKTVDNCILVEYTTESDSRRNLCIDLRNGVSITTYDSLTPAAWEFRSQVFLYDTPVVFDHFRVDGTETVSLDVYADGVLIKTLEVTGKDPIPLVTNPADDSEVTAAYEWYFHMRSVGVVRRFEAYERSILSMDGGTLELTPDRVGTWRSIWVNMGQPDRLSGIQVVAQHGGETDVRLFADGAPAAAVTTTGTGYQKFARGTRRGRLWMVDAHCDKAIDRLVLVRRQQVPAGAVIRELNDGPIPPWAGKVYELEKPTALQAITVEADAYPQTINLYYDRAETATLSVTVSGPHEHAIASSLLTGCVEFDVASDKDHEIRDIAIKVRVERNVSDGGIDETDPDSLIGVHYKFPDRGGFACGAIGATNYESVRLELTADGAVVFDQMIANGFVFQFPRSLPRAANWIRSIYTQARVFRLLLIPWRRESFAGDILPLVRPEAGVSPWLFTKWQSIDRMTPTSVDVFAESYPIPFRVFKDGDTEPTETISVTEPGEVRFTAVAGTSEYSFDFGGNDHLVKRANVYFKQPRILAEGQPAVITGPGLRKNVFRFTFPNAFACGFVAAPAQASDPDLVSNPVWLHFYADGDLVLSKRVVVGHAFTLPKSMPKASTYEVDIETTADVGVVTLMPYVHIPARDVIESRVGSALFPSWMYGIFEFAAPWIPRSFKVSTSETVSLDLYVNDATTRTKRFTVSDNTEVRIDNTYHVRTVQFDFAGEDHLVSAAYMFGEDSRPVEGGGLVIPGNGRVAWRNIHGEFKDTGSWSGARLAASAYPIPIRLILDGAVQQTLSVTSADEAEFSASLPNGKGWDIDIDPGTANIDSLVLLAREWYPVKNGVVFITRDREPWSWFGKYVLFPSPAAFATMRVTADAYPVQVRFTSAAGAVLLTSSAHDGRSIWLPRMRPDRQVKVDVIYPSTTQVHELALGMSLEAIRR